MRLLSWIFAFWALGAVMSDGSDITIAMLTILSVILAVGHRLETAIKHHQSIQEG